MPAVSGSQLIDAPDKGVEFGYIVMFCSLIPSQLVFTFYNNVTFMYFMSPVMNINVYMGQIASVHISTHIAVYSEKPVSLL